MMTSNKYHHHAERLADLVTSKNEIYGDSVSKAPQILTILYPHGIPKEAYDQALYITRLIDKLSRIATITSLAAEASTDDHRGGTEQPLHDAWSDICGYALLMIKYLDEGGETSHDKRQ